MIKASVCFSFFILALWLSSPQVALAEDEPAAGDGTQQTSEAQTESSEEGASEEGSGDGSGEGSGEASATDTSGALRPEQIPLSDPSLERFGFIPTTAVKRAELERLSHPLTQVLTLETSFGESIALYQPAAMAEPRGTVILVPDINNHAEWPGELSPLRLGLADDGWHTIALLIPDSPLTVRRHNEPEEADTEAAEAYQNLTQSLIDAALMQANNYGGDALVILGVGNGVHWAAQTASQRATNEAQAAAAVAEQRQSAQQNQLPGAEPPPPIADATANSILVMVDAPAGTDVYAANMPSLEERLSTLTLPVIDVYRHESLGHRDPYTAAATRKRLAAAAGLKHYYQRSIRGNGQSWQQSSQWLVKNVRGALRTFALPLLTVPAKEDNTSQSSETPPG